MDIRSLKCAVALLDEAHFGRAANRLNITQPAFSQRIAVLEKEVGHTLFVRTRGPIRPTAAGIALVKRAKVVIDNADAVKEEVHLAATGMMGRLRIGFTQIALYQNLPEWLREFRNFHPAIETKTQELLSLQQEQSLVDGSIDVGLVHPPLVFRELDYFQLESVKLVIVMPDHWPQAKQSWIDLADCADIPFMLPPRSIGPVFYDGIISACNQAGFSPKIVQEAAPMSTLIGLVSAGIGAGFITEGLSVIKRQGVCYVEVKGCLPELPLAVAWKRSNNNPMVERFVRGIKESKKS